MHALGGKQGISNRYRAALLIVALFQAIAWSSFLKLPPPLLTPFISLLALILIPGILTMLAIKNRCDDPIQLAGLGLGLGLAENILFGRLLLLIGVPVQALAFLVLATSLLKIAWLWRHPIHLDWNLWNDSRAGWLLLAVPLLILMAYWITVTTANLTFPEYPLNQWDKWTYLTVIEQFQVSPSHLYLRPDAVIFGSNTRLAWNGWLYVTAELSQLSNLHPVQFIFRYFRPVLGLFIGLGIYSFAYELFRKRWIALAALAFHLLVILNNPAITEYMWFRLEEDKFFALFLLVPLAWAFLLRALESFRWQDLFGLAALSLAAALTHPIGLPGLLMTGCPILVLEWIISRGRLRTLRQIVVIAVCMIIFLFIPFVDQALVNADPYVQAYLAQNGSLPVYSADTAICLIDPSPVPRLILLAALPMLFFALKDRTARVIVVITLICASLLCISPLTALLSHFVTSVGLDRYEWLIPGGLIIAFWLNKLDSWVLPRLNFRYRAALLPLVMALFAFLLVYQAGWFNWRTRVNQLLNTSEPAKPTTDLGLNTWDAFVNTASTIGESRAVTPTQYGIVAPTLWPFADLLIYNSPKFNAESWQAIDRLYQAEDLATAQTLINDLRIEYMLVPHAEKLYHTLSENSQDFTVIYQNDDVTIFKVIG